MKDRTAHPRILTANEVAARLRVSCGKVYAAVARGEIPCVRLFGRRSLRFKAADIEAILNSANGTPENEYGPLK